MYIEVSKKGNKLTDIMKTSNTVKRAKEKGISLKQAIKEQAEKNGYKLNSEGKFEKK